MYNSFGSVSKTPNRTLQNTKFMYINSANRNQGTNSEFTIYFPPTLFTNNSNNQKWLKISLYNLTVNREWTDVIDGINNIFQYFDGTNLHSITIPEGSYSAYSLRDYLNTVLTGTTVTYSITQNKYTFTFVDPTSWINATTCGAFLGLTNGKTYTGTFTSEFSLNLQWEDTLFLNTDIANSSHNIDNVNQLEIQTSTIIDRIPIEVPPFSNIIYNANEKHSTLEIPMLNNLTTIRFWLTTNKLRRLTNLNQPFNFTLRIDIYEQ